MKYNEKEVLESFTNWLMIKNPKIATCIEMYKLIDCFIVYKLNNVGNSEFDSYDAEFAKLMKDNFEK